jgi:hypothetical protein
MALTEARGDRSIRTAAAREPERHAGEVLGQEPAIAVHRQPGDDQSGCQRPRCDQRPSSHSRHR